MSMKDKVRNTPHILLSDVCHPLKYTLINKFMRQFIIQFSFDSVRQFDFFMQQDGSFVFKTNSLNHWAVMKDNISDWKREFCELTEKENYFNFKALESTVSDIIKDRDGVGLNYLAVSQMLTKYFKVYIKQEGVIYRVEFADGDFVKCSKEFCESKEKETWIEFMIDDEVLHKAGTDDSTHFSYFDFADIAQKCAMFFPGSKITVHNENSDAKTAKCFCYDSLAEYAVQKYKCSNVSNSVFLCESSESEQVQSVAEIRIAVGKSSNDKNVIEAYCNYKNHKYGKVLNAINDVLKTDDLHHYVVVINIFMTQPLWENACQNGIKNQYLYDSIYKYINSEIGAAE